MPINKKESLIYTALMCGFMVFVMSVYNISLQMGFSRITVAEAWIGFPIAYIIAFICDWFIVSGPAKAFAFKLVGMESKPIVKIIAVSSCMICGMVIIMSLYGAIIQVGLSKETFSTWMLNIIRNVIVAIPLQLIIAGPFVRFVFRKAFPIGTIVVTQK